jgi:hypothetical protein
MSAKNGSMRSFRLLGCLMAVTLLASALFASTASAKKTPPTNKTAYIVLGDSISYGYSEEKFDLNFPAEPVSAFEGGFGNLLGEKLAKKEAKLGNLLEVKNLSCPGETSKGLIGDGPVAEGLEAAKETTHFTGGEAPCGWHNVDGFPRHVEYGAASQLEAAMGLIAAGNEPGGAPVKDITLQIGSNDELHKLGECKSKAYDEAHGFESFIACVEFEAEHVLFPTIINNIGLTIHELREAGYTGPIAILGFYNPQTFLVAGSDPLQRELNEATEGVIKAGSFGPKVAYANPFKKVNPQQKKSESSSAHEALERGTICLYSEECNEFDKHQNLIEFLESAEGGSHSHAEAEAAATPEATKAFPSGDIHPTHEGHELFTKLLTSALKKAA